MTNHLADPESITEKVALSFGIASTHLNMSPCVDCQQINGQWSVAEMKPKLFQLSTTSFSVSPGVIFLYPFFIKVDYQNLDSHSISAKFQDMPKY